MSKKTTIFNGISLICAIVGAACALVCRIITPSPVDMAHKLDSLDVLPPVWIFNLLSVALCFAAGAAAGVVIKDVGEGNLCGKSAIGAYRGLAFFLVAFFVSLMWYPAFFAAEAIFISMVMCLAATLGSVLCAYNWFGVGEGTAAVIMSAFSIWSVYILLINISVLFGI